MSIVEWIIVTIIQIYTSLIMLYCYKKLSKSNLLINPSNVIIIIFISIILIFNNLYNIVYIRLLTSIIINILLNKLIYKNKLKICIKYTLIYFVISFIIELLLIPLFSVLSIQNINVFNKEILIKNLFSISESFLVLAAFSNNRLQVILNKVLLSSSKISYSKITIVTIMFFNIITILLSKDLDNNHILLLAISSITFIIISYKIIINDKYNILELKIYNDNLKSSSEAYSKTIDECRELKHNLKNDLIGIKSFIPKEYHNEINELILKYNKRYEWISKIDDIPEGIQGVIYLKSNEAKKKHIKMYIDVKENIKSIDKNYFELSSILGIVLDNAIENSTGSKEKVISVYIKSTKNNLIIEIINTFSNKVDLDKLGNKNYSTKKEKSGLGLNYIKSLNKRNIKVKYEIVNNLFKTNIIYTY